MALNQDEDGRPLVDPKLLAEEWVKLDKELTQNPDIAEVVFDRAIGKAVRLGKRVTSSARPTVSEAPGGRRQEAAVLTESARKMGLNKTDLDSSNKTYATGRAGESPIGEW